MNKLFKSITSSLALGSLLALGQAASADKITLTEFKYASAQASIHVVKEIIETRLGVEVDKKPGNNAVFYAGMAKGDGDFDAHLEGWYPNQIALVDEYVRGTKEISMSEHSYGATSGFCVPRYFAEANNIKHITDLSRPEVAAQLDSDGDGMGEIWVGKPGWLATNENHVKARDYGLLALNTETRHDAAVHFANLAAAVKQKKGYAGYCWAPDGVWKMYDVVQLEEPPYEASCNKVINQKNDPDWFENSVASCASAPKSVYILWSKTLEDRLPIVASLLGNITLDTETVSNWAYEVGSLKRPAAEGAAEWIAANEDRVNGWLGM